MADFDVNRAIADASSYNDQTRMRGQRQIREEMKRLETEVRRLEGLLDASRARDEVATDLLRAEVRRTVAAEAERDRWQSEAERIAALLAPASPKEGND